jgi:hypothetical protein
MQRALVLGIAIALMACASDSGPKASREETQVTTLRYRVAEVDQATRMVTLVDGSGAKTRFRADERVKNLPQVKVGDQVVATLVETTAVEVRKALPDDQKTPGTAAALVATAEPGEKPAGLYLGQIQGVYTIESIDKARGGGTLRDANGETAFVKARDPSILDRVKVGDTVVVTITQGLSLEVLPPGTPGT